jgi:hypothetical protein
VRNLTARWIVGDILAGLDVSAAASALTGELRVHVARFGIGSVAVSHVHVLRFLSIVVVSERRALEALAPAIDTSHSWYLKSIVICYKDAAAASA